MGNNKELPVNPTTGTAATRTLKLDPIPGTTESGFQDNRVLNLDPVDSPSIDRSSSVTNLDWGKYEKYINQAFIPEGGVDELTKARARNQSTWEQLGNQTVQTTAGILFGIAENAGYLFDLEAHVDTATGTGNDYSNILTEFAQRGRAALEDNFAVYRENPDQVFDLSDPAWWIGHGGNLVESIGEFAVTGYGVGKVLGTGAKALAGVFKNAKHGAQIARGLSSTATALTAAELAYVEGAMGGQEVYKSTYDKAIEQGLSQDEAITKASTAAATTVQLNTLINTALNVTSAKMFTRPMGGAKKLDQAFGRQVGESLTDWKKRLAEGAKNPSMISELLKEGSQEALEEVVNEISTALGHRKGDELLDLLSDKDKKGGKLATIIETLGKDETMLAAILGAMGGVGQTAITSMLPNAKARKKAETESQQKQLQYVIDRLDSFETAQGKLNTALQQGDSKAYHKALEEIFATEAFTSIINGTEEQLAGLYEEVSNMTQEVAEAAGYNTDSSSPDYYKTRAKDAIDDIKKLSKDYEHIINKHNAYDSEAAQAGYGENVFKKHLIRHNLEREIDRAQKRVDQAKADHLKNIQRRGTSMDLETAIDINNNIKASEQSVSNLGNEINDVISTDARGKAGARALETKYGKPPKGTSRKQHAINQIEARAKRLLKQRDKYISELEKAKQDFVRTGNNESDFHEALQMTSYEQSVIQDGFADIFEARESLKDVEDNIKEFTSKEGRAAFIEDMKKHVEKVEAEAKAAADKQAADDKAKEEAEKREAASKPAKDKKAEAESRKQSEESNVVEDPEVASETTESQTTEVEPEPEFNDEGESVINKDIVSEGLSKSEETSPETELQDGDVQNPSEKKRSEMTATKESNSTSDFLVVQAANTFAYLSNDYEVVDGKKETVTSEKNQGLARELESSVEFQPGDSITLEVDKTATWQDKDGQTWSYNDFVNEDGSVDIANVPIAIKKNGKTVAYVRTNDWILQKYEGSDAFANVADSTDPESAMYNNAERQATLNLALRKEVIKQGSVETVITNKSLGTLNQNLVDGKKTKGKMSELVPKAKTLVVVKNGQFHINKEEIYSDRSLANSKKFLENLTEYNGLVFVELVGPNGQALMVPTSIPNLSQDQAETIFNALEAKLSNNEAVRSQVFGETDFDLFTDSGIFEFLKLFTHTTDESDDNFKAKVDGAGKDDARHLNYSTKTGKISYARHNRGIVTINTLEELQANKTDLLAFLGEKLFSVRISAINGSEKVSEPVIKSDGTVETNHFNNYNDYVKTHLETDVKGNAINENEESYFNQPVIEFSQSFVNSPIQKTGQVANTENASSQLSTQTNNQSEIEDAKSDQDLLNDIDSLMGFDDTIDYQEDVDPVNDSEMNDLQNQFLRDGLEAFLVVDKETKTPYNSYKQSEVVNSIVELAVKAMQTGDKASEAFNKAKEVFSQRQKLYAAAEKNFDTLTEDQKRKLAVTTIDDVTELHDEFEKVNRNWEAFQKLSKEHLAKLFGIKETLNDTKEEGDVQDALDGFEELESHLEKVSFDDGATFQTNHKDTASARLKLFLALQESPTRTFLNLKSFIPFDTVYDDLQQILAGIEPNFDAFIRQLHLRSINNPYVKGLITKLESGDQQLKNEFVVAFSKQYNKFETTLWSVGKKDGKPFMQLRNIESNRNDVIKRIESQWVEDQKRSPIVKTVSGKLVIDPEVANAFRVEVINLASAPTPEGAQALLAKIGINMPIEALRELEKNSVKLTGQTFAQHFKTGMFKHMSDAFFKTREAESESEVESLLELNNPLTGIDREGSSIKVLATLTSQFSESVYSNSHRDSEGKTIYSYSLNTALSHKMRELTENDGNNSTLTGLAKISFSKYSHWGEQLRTNAEFRDNFEMFYLDGLSKARSNQPGVKRNDQSDREMELQALSLFQNQGRKQGHFIYPTISDKTTTPIISALKHRAKVMFNEDGTYVFGKSTKKLIHDIVRSEIDRIENYKPGKNKIKGYDTGGATKLFMFPELNEILGDNILPDGKIPVDIQTKLFAAAEQHVKNMVESTVKAWEELKIKTDKSLSFDKTYINTVLKTEVQGGNLDLMARYAAIDLEVNYMLANANIMQLISGDPAQYFKKNVETTLVEYTKRLAKDIAPGLDGNFSKPKYKVVFLKDKETNSKHLKEYRKIIGEKAESYTGMEGTDAQEYTTLQEHLDVMFAYGKLSEADYKRFTTMAKEGKDFSGKELDVILQPMKPVYVGNEFDFERDLNKITYIKSSSFPLIPQLTKGLEIDALRVQMERHGIDRAAYVTAAKLGATKIVETWDGDVMSENFDLKDKSVVLDRSGFRIQQEVPYKEDKVKILTVSQMNKLLFEGILGIEGMPELKARKEEIRKQLFKKGKAKLLKSIGAVETSDGNYEFKDLTKIKDVLIKEAMDRGYPINDIQALELTEDKKAFKIPIGFNASSKKFESILMSLISNNVLKQKISGKSYVQASSAGILTGANNSIKWSELSKKELGGVVFVGDVNLDEGLKFVRKEGSVVKGAQLLVPFYFRDSNGKPLNIKDYTIEIDGKIMIDPNKMDSDLLRLIGARIPNQGHSSMLPIEIAGFLPESMGDLIIVPDEITKQMGADFDVDKLYTYQYQYNIEENGNLSKVSSVDGVDTTESLKNEYIDIHWKVLTNPEVLPRVLSPLDQKGEYSVAGEAAKIHAIRSKNAKPESFLYRRAQQKAFMQNRGGKSGVGIFSLASTFNATIQDQNLILGEPTKKGIRPIVIDVFKGFDLVKLSGKGTNPIADKAAVISDMQSAAVDNAKEQTLDKLNLNDYTFAAANAMAQLENSNGKNLTIQHISRLLSQQVILDYVKEVERLSDSTTDNFITKPEEEAFRIVTEKYKKKATDISKDFKLDLDNMLSMIENESAPNGEWYAQQLKVLEAFAKFHEIGSAMTNIQSAINSDSKGVDPSYFQVSDKLDRIVKIRNNPFIRGVEPLLTSNTEVGEATQMGPILAKDLMSKFLPQGSYAMKSVFNELSKLTGRSELSAAMKQRIFDAFKAYIFSSSNMFNQTATNIREELMIDNETPSLATRIKEAQETWGKRNFLLRRLMPKFSDIIGDPSTVEYVASTGERLDEQESLKAFIDMLASSDPIQSKLAEDLVRYTYATSGTQHAHNFMKFVPNIYLKAIGIDEKLRNFSWTDTSSTIPFSIQFIQNNPDFAAKITESVEKYIKDDYITLPKIDEDLPKDLVDLIYTIEDDGGEVEIKYPNFFQTRENNQYKLYQNIGQNDNGEVVYARVDTLGGKGGIVEYDSEKRVNSSMYSINKAPISKKAKPSVRPVLEVSSTIDNPNAFTEPLKRYKLKKSMPSNEFMESIKVISEISDNPGHRLLAEILYGIKDNLKPFEFVVDNSIPVAGRFSSAHGKLSINTVEHSNKNGFNSNMLERTMLHELIHGYTSELVNSYFKNDPLPANVSKSIKSLDAVRQKVYNSLSEDEKLAIDEFAALTPEERKSSTLPRSVKARYYALGNTKEFITMTLTEVEFQRYLNEIPFEGTKTIMDRFMEVLSRLYKAIAESAGIEIKKDSALDAALNESINLLMESTPINNDSGSVDDMISLSTQYNPVNSRMLQQIRSEFGLLNEKGSAGRFLHTNRGYAKAEAKALELNTKNKKFMEKYGNNYKAFVTKAFGEKGDTRVYYVISFTENDSYDYSIDSNEDSSVSPSIAKVIRRLNSRIRDLNRSMSESKSNKVSYQEKIDALERQIEKLEEENSLKEIAATAKVNLDWASNMLDHKKISASELSEVESIINVWRDVKSLFKDDYESGGKYQEVLAEISNRAEDLEIKFLDISKMVMLKELNATSSREVKMKDLELMSDITATRANMLDLSHVDNPVVQALDTWLKNATRDANTEFATISKEINNAFSKLKAHSEFKKNGFDIFMQKDKDGKWTGGLTHRYSQDWYDAKRKAWSKVKRDKGNAKKWKSHFDWLKKNEIIVDTRVLFDQNGNLNSDVSSKKHMKELATEFGEARAEKMVNQAKEKYMNYLRDLEAYTLSVETEKQIDPELTDKMVADKIQRWKLENSPKAYIDNYKGGLIIKGLKMRGNKYTVSKPRKIIDGKPSNWYDKNYEKIENDSVLLEFYNFYKTTMAKNVSELPTYALAETQNNFIPFVKKQLIERFNDSGLKGGFAGMWGSFADSISSVESATVSADRDMRTGRVNQRIPINFLEEGSIEDKSTNLVKVLEMFTSMSLNYKHKSKIEDKVLILQRLINESAQKQVTANNQAQVDTEGNLYETKDGNVNLKKLVQHTIDYSLYNKKRNPGDATGIFISDGLKSSVRATKLAREIKALNRQLELGTITNEEHTKKVEPLQKELTELGGKNVSTADIADFTMKVTQLKGMALNIFSASNNMTFGLVSNIIHAAGGEDFSMKEALQAYRIMLNSTAKSLRLDRVGVGADVSKKLNSLIEKFDVLFEVNEAAYRGSSKDKSSVSKFTPYELQKRGEYFVQGMNMVARMLNEKVKTLDGKETTLFEAFDTEGNWRTDVYGENKSWSGDINSDEEMKDFRKFRNRLIQINKRVHGNYDPASFPMMKKSVLGRFAMQFRSWLAESVASRFDHEQWDEQLGRNTKGTYRTIGQLGPMQTIKAFAKIALGKGGNMTDMSKVDQANLKKAFAELSFIIAVNIIGLSVMALSDDDDEDKTVRNIVINQLYRAESDLTFYLTPSSFDRILSNPIPAIRTYLDAEKALNGTVQYVMQDEETEGRKKLEDSDVLFKILNVFPLLNQIPKASAQGEKVFK